ncbi:hypothetical protein R4146_07735 [Nicoliella sp. Es01]|uniref:Uncharacterized protein n=1 Tax=Nicoliella lavandulae TaxID=3082954 RepID=A0ABU8SMA8_9LACO
MPVQFKAISDDEDQAKDLGLFLRRLFYYEEPLEQLDNQGIKPVKCSSIPGIPSYADNLIQFVSGADMTFVVIDDVVDLTRGNQRIEKVGGIVTDQTHSTGINAIRKDE